MRDGYAGRYWKDEVGYGGRGICGTDMRDGYEGRICGTDMRDGYAGRI